jgi:hypothetical protein
MALFALFGTLMNSYQLTAKTRARDQVRALLESYCDRFLRGPTVILPPDEIFFQTCSATPLPGTGTGLKWDWETTVLLGDGGGLVVPLGGSGDTTTDAQKIHVTIKRWVSEVDEDTGVPNTSQVYSRAGRMLVATFTAIYDVNRRQQTITLTVARTDDPQ